MLKKVNKKALIDDVLKNAMILILVHVISRQLAGQIMFDAQSIRDIAVTLLAVAIYHVIMAQLQKSE